MIGADKGAVRRQSLLQSAVSTCSAYNGADQNAEYASVRLDRLRILPVFKTPKTFERHYVWQFWMVQQDRNYNNNTTYHTHT